MWEKRKRCSVRREDQEEVSREGLYIAPPFLHQPFISLGGEDQGSAVGLRNGWEKHLTHTHKHRRTHTHLT